MHSVTDTSRGLNKKKFEENPVYGSIEYVRHMYREAKNHRLENSEYSDGILDGINMLIAAGLVRREDIQ